MTAHVPAPVQAVLDAVEAGDRRAFLAAFSPAGTVDDWGRRFTGEKIAEWSDAEFIGKNVTLTVDDVEVEGAQVVVRAQVGGNGFNGPSTFTFTMYDDVLSEMTIRA